MFALTRSPGSDRLALSTIQESKSSVSERTARRPGETRPRRQRHVSVIVNLPHHNRAVAPKLPSAGSGPSGPLNKKKSWHFGVFVCLFQVLPKKSPRRSESAGGPVEAASGAADVDGIIEWTTLRFKFARSSSSSVPLVVERQRQGGAPTEPHDSRRQGLVSVTLSTTLGSI
jgi:hypothetical protein